MSQDAEVGAPDPGVERFALAKAEAAAAEADVKRRPLPASCEALPPLRPSSERCSAESAAKPIFFFVVVSLMFDLSSCLLYEQIYGNIAIQQSSVCITIPWQENTKHDKQMRLEMQS